jgi:hypothetical protein
MRVFPYSEFVSQMIATSRSFSAHHEARLMTGASPEKRGDDGRNKTLLQRFGRLERASLNIMAQLEALDLLSLCQSNAQKGAKPNCPVLSA